MSDSDAALKHYARQIKALVVVPSAHLGGMIRNMLQYTIGAPDVVLARSTTEALDLMLQRRFNLLLLDVAEKQSEALAFIKEIRSGHGEVPRELPIISMIQAPTRALVESLRDLGVNEILVIPVAVGHLIERIKSVFENPRDWVFTPHYVGPDRRRKKKPDFKGSDRRGHEDEPADDALVLTDTLDEKTAQSRKPPQAKG